VLVTEIDRRAVPKVIDFGIAKALSQRLTDRTLHTERGQLIGTPVYMSPEQAGMSAIEVDTRTDVYSLGALLYELLTGVPPFDPKVFSSGGLLEVQRLIREQEPPRPSSRVLKAAAEASPIALAERRRTEPRALARMLRGELDWIVMKALEKDRARRYGFVSDLAADLVRHLEHRPVSAGPPSGAYILRKFVRRHRALVVSSGIALLSLVIGLLMATVGLLRSQRSEQAALQEAAKASEVSELLRQMLAAPNPYQGLSRDVTVREVLDGAASRFDGSLRDQPEVEATLRLTIGSTYRDLGDLERAEPQIRRAVSCGASTAAPPSWARRCASSASCSTGAATSSRPSRRCARA
jgi:hypothetical protein